MAVFELQKHRSMWYYLASQAQNIINEYMSELRPEALSKVRIAYSVLDRWKDAWIRTEGHDKNIRNNCYACQYAYELGCNDSTDICDHCPFGEEFYCDVSDSLYDKLLCAIIEADGDEVSCLCKDIANYSIKNDIVVDVVFERTKHINMWLWLSEHIDDIINAKDDETRGVEEALCDYKRKYLQEHNESINLSALCYACEYEWVLGGSNCDSCPLVNFFCVDDNNSLYNRLLRAIENGNNEEAKDLCVKIANNPVKKNVLWQ